ncbi:MAG: methyltransferase domain-containing protein [Bacteroidia bacterium]|nr:methyltransferase domain-containing protein [Bacteroidota bacterium]MBK7430887.1 methyltransferase domain-containing protein [Bacteroidota bacterium]MBP9791366.1 methyltransferase domain-containing protein [Bacteroidia bacterium]MBP9923290.1 methyltransferase domain-containing protein [Bacteroidia bacterium]
MQNLTTCPVCGGESSKKVMDCIDYTVSRETFSIVQCTKCGFKYTNPRPDDKEIGKYYESEEYVSHSNSKKGLINTVYHWVRNYSLRKKVELINNQAKKGNLLDIGCGTGEFLSTAVANGWKGQGIEPNDKARYQAISNHKLNVLPESGIASLQNNNFDVITMWHVLEHVHTLNERVLEIYSLLKPGGKAIIAVPNCTSYDASVYGKEWAAYDVPRHLYHFTPETMKALFRKHKMDFVQSYPMKFDSFYVSMLTEKNVHKQNRLLPAFLNGFKSNLKTKNDAEKYSSVIYVFVK